MFGHFYLIQIEGRRYPVRLSWGFNLNTAIYQEHFHKPHGLSSTHHTAFEKSCATSHELAFFQLRLAYHLSKA